MITLSVIVKELVVRAELGVDLVHVFFYDAGNGFIVAVAGFSVLEEYVAVFV